MTIAAAGHTVTHQRDGDNTGENAGAAVKTRMQDDSRIAYQSTGENTDALIHAATAQSPVSAPVATLARNCHQRQRIC